MFFANKKRTLTDIKILENQLKLFKLDNQSYPNTSEGLKSLVEKPDSRKYSKNIKRLPEVFNDPWGNPYQYHNPGSHGEIDIYSWGEDGVPSEDDIGNWSLEK